MLTNKNWLSLITEKLRNRVNQIGLFVEYPQCVCMKIVYSIFIMHGVKLITEKNRLAIFSCDTLCQWLGKVRLQHMMALSHYHGNNQDSMHGLFSSLRRRCQVLIMWSLGFFLFMSFKLLVINQKTQFAPCYPNSGTKLLVYSWNWVQYEIPDNRLFANSSLEEIIICKIGINSNLIVLLCVYRNSNSRSKM